MVSPHFILRAVLVLAANALAAGTPAAEQPSTIASASSNFTIFVGSVRVGNEQIAVERSADGWTIAGSGQLGPPVDVITRRITVRYDLDWKPRELALDATAQGRHILLRTIVDGTTAKNTITVNGMPEEKVDPIDASAVLLLPGSFFAPYEAIAARVRTAAAGTTISAYLASQTSIGLAVGESTEEKIQTVGRMIEARRTKLTLIQSGLPPIDAEIWGDETGRLLRLTVPTQSLDVVREDIGSVSTRRITVSRPGDEQVRIPATGFSLAGTISKPADAANKRSMALVLVGGSGLTDRDETIAGIPIFGHLAGMLADAGFMVLRYDKRAVGQSGGRAESATLSDYADDLRAAVRFMSNRKDVDHERIAVLGHGEGGAVAMLAAAKEDRIAALVLVAAPGMTGAELNLARVTRGLERSARTAAEKQSTIELQNKIQTAVLTGKGWDDIPAATRRQADNPWFQSFLSFDPARIMRGIDQPVLIIQPQLDTEVMPVNAERLEAMARARRKARGVDVVLLPGLNHLLVPAATGEPDEYGALKDRTVSPAVLRAMASWLQATLVAAR